MNPASLLLSSSVASHSCAASILFGNLQHLDTYRELGNSTGHSNNHTPCSVEMFCTTTNKAIKKIRFWLISGQPISGQDITAAEDNQVMPVFWQTQC